MAASDQYEIVVGLEVHIQLQTDSKLFASDSTTYGEGPNSNISVITLAHPGTLPKLNKKAAEYAIKMGLACQSQISRYNIFDRKNYFYPDSPKGFQTTQDNTPICVGGNIKIELDGNQKSILLNRIHLEEDAGKSIHEEGANDSLIDLNRAGIPLVELVTEPMISSSQEAMSFLNQIRKIVSYLDICDGNMEEGSLRCDANISVRKKEETALGKKVEVKNMNSVRNVGKAIECEAERQVSILEKGKSIVSETRLFDADKAATFGMRTKEELNDYRYFPEPDLAPFEVSDDWLDSIKEQMPSLHWELKEKFIHQYSLPAYDAELLTESKEVAAYFEELCEHTSNFKAASNWMMGPVKSHLNEKSKEINELTVGAERLSKVIALVEEGKVSFSMATNKLFPYLLENAEDPSDALRDLGLEQKSDLNSIRPVIVSVLEKHPDKIIEYHNGKRGLIGMFMGEVMRASGGAVDPKVANKLVAEVLEELK
ncbi:MAG: Asp-tRNA(Asn)/Glu-tRNA(Gln) amidotransferase subunit GatB [Bacteroidota bacterium]